MKLVQQDLEEDCSHLSLSARGAWVWIFLHLRHRGGERTLSMDGWVSVVRAPRDQVVPAIAEIVGEGVCDSNLTSKTIRENGNGEVRITCRRLVREAKLLERNAFYQQQHRDRLARKEASKDEVSTVEIESRGKSKEKERERARKRATPAPDAFEISSDLREWAAREAPGIDAERETKSFLLKSKARGTVYKDWTAAWKNWILKAVEFASERAAPSNGTRSSQIGRNDAPVVRTPEREAEREEMRRRALERDEQRDAAEESRIRALAHPTLRERQWLEVRERSKQGA